MATLLDWVVLGSVVTSFTSLGCLKLVGLWRGVVGGGDKPFIQKLCGT